MIEMVTASVQHNKDSPLPMLFSTVPTICEPLSYQPVAYTKQCYGHLANLELADSSRVGDKLQIDALIGSENYWQLVTGQIVQGDSGPTAIHTHFGWVLSGQLIVQLSCIIHPLATQCSSSLLINLTWTTY